MNDQERQVISDIFRRLEQVANQPRDPEAERFIADKLRQQPYAPYAMAQSVYVQEQALARLQAENEQLRGELDRLHHQPQQGGFLSSIFGGGSRPPGPAYNAPPARGASPWGGSQPMQQPYGAPQGGMVGGQPGPWGGGGMMIANALSSAFGGAEPGAAGDAAAAADLGGSEAGGAGDVGNAGITDSLYGNQQNDQGDSFADFSGDAGDGGDWA